jgi:hypothetical protein
MKRLVLTVLWCAFLLCAFGTAQAATPTLAQWTIGSSIHNFNANTVTYWFPHTTGANNLIVCGIIMSSGLTAITATDDKSNSSVNHVSSDVNGRMATVASELRYSEVFLPSAPRQQLPIKWTAESLLERQRRVDSSSHDPRGFHRGHSQRRIHRTIASADSWIGRRHRSYLCKIFVIHLKGGPHHEE